MTTTETWQAWQVKLADAQQALSEFEANLGALAQTEDAGALATKLTELRNAVVIADAATETARRNAPDPRVAQKQAQLEAATAGAAQWQAEAEKWGAIKQELEPRYVEARDRCVGAIKQLMIFERSVMQYGIDLNELQRATE